jgi:hypothetical protein
MRLKLKEDVLHTLVNFRELTYFMYSTTLLFVGVTFLKPPPTVKPRYAKFRPYGQNGVRGTKYTRNMTLNMYN